jgi:hypothetical protein
MQKHLVSPYGKERISWYDNMKFFIKNWDTDKRK